MTKNSNKFYQRAHVRIIHETIDDDTLIINLDSGHYYSLTSVASRIWKFLIQGKNKEEICEIFIKLSDANSEVFLNDLNEFIAELIAENILIEASEKEALETVKEIDQTKFVYSRPVFNKFTDMEALLLADPIHEFVDGES